MLRSLFDRPTPTLMKIRREIKAQKMRGVTGAPRFSSLASLPAGMLPQQRTALALKQGAVPQPDNLPPWLIFEDWSLLQAIQNMQEINLNLFIINPGHTPNWDLEADMVNSVSRAYRSPKQCRARYGLEFMVKFWSNVCM